MYKQMYLYIELTLTVYGRHSTKHLFLDTTGYKGKKDNDTIKNQVFRCIHTDVYIYKYYNILLIIINYYNLLLIILKIVFKCSIVQLNKYSE